LQFFLTADFALSGKYQAGLRILCNRQAANGKRPKTSDQPIASADLPFTQTNFLLEG